MDTWTIQRILEWSIGFLERKEIDSPRLTAELLLGDVLKCSRVELYLRFEQPLDPDERAVFREYLKRRVAYEPTQYILGSQSFWSLELQVDARVLIPRPETECLIEECLRLFKQGALPLRGPFLDVCTGSGALACALAVEFPEADVDATDISPDALDVAQINIENNQLSERVHLHEGSLFEAVPQKKYAAIVTNPPYIRSDEMATLQHEVREYEPHLALDGGDDGLDLIRIVLKEAPDYLTEQGILLIEMGCEQGALAMQLAREYDVYTEVRVLQDYAGLDRVLCCRVGTQPEPVQDEPIETTFEPIVEEETIEFLDQSRYAGFSEYTDEDSEYIEEDTESN